MGDGLADQLGRCSHSRKWYGERRRESTRGVRRVPSRASDISYADGPLQHRAAPSVFVGRIGVIPVAAKIFQAAGLLERKACSSTISYGGDRTKHAWIMSLLKNPTLSVSPLERISRPYCASPIPSRQWS